ncbi:hypothetical protein M0802_009072 [Mischocyttarus mexicanus]|nr:hypothetical protein M0802_009072 [Mischocyttarus mexicanus]
MKACEDRYYVLYIDSRWIRTGWRATHQKRRSRRKKEEEDEEYEEKEEEEEEERGTSSGTNEPTNERTNERTSSLSELVVMMKLGPNYAIGEFFFSG